MNQLDTNTHNGSYIVNLPNYPTRPKHPCPSCDYDMWEFVDMEGNRTYRCPRCDDVKFYQL